MLQSAKRDVFIKRDAFVTDGKVVLVRKKGQGVFLGLVTALHSLTKNDYVIIDIIDISKYFETIDKEKRKAELEEMMDIRMKELDETQKYELYAKMDSGFAQI